MNRLSGIPTLNAGAPDLRLSGDQTQRGTYVQRRRNQMAYGGIAGLDGRKAYGIGSWFQKAKDKFVDDIVPNELKSPAGAALAATAANYLPVMMGGDNTLLQKGIGAITGTTPENNALDYLKSIIPGQGGDILTGPIDIKDLDKELGTTSGGNILTDIGGAIGTGIGNIGGMIGTGIGKAGELLGKIPEGLGTLLSVIPGGAGTVLGWDSDKSLAENLAGLGTAGKVGAAVTAGLAAGKLQQDYLDKQPAFPADETGIKFQTAAEAMADPNLRFKPQAQYANVAEGGRIGYALGKSVEKQRDIFRAWDAYKSSGGQREFQGWFKDVWLPASQGFDEPLDIEDWRRSVASTEEEWPYGYAEPGTIGSPEMITIGKMAQGGRIGAQEGGLMNLGGMEKDYRNEGGFVPIGAEEKADDVPARLSKNEFVFTADAVRAAGGGDIDRGAAVMENLMENLEGARGMYANTQKLQNRII